MDQRAAAAGHEAADEGMDLGLGRDIDALRGLVEQKHGDRRASHLARITFC